MPIKTTPLHLGQDISKKRQLALKIAEMLRNLEKFTTVVYCDSES